MVNCLLVYAIDRLKTKLLSWKPKRPFFLPNKTSTYTTVCKQTSHRLPARYYGHWEGRRLTGKLLRTLSRAH